MVKVYISELEEKKEEYEEILKIQGIEIVNNIEDSTHVIVGPGGMSNLMDMSKAVQLKKNVFLYDKDMFFSKMKMFLSQCHLVSTINELKNVVTEEQDEVHTMVREGMDENGKVNNGESGKLL